MATVRDTKHTQAFFEGRAVLDPTTLNLEEWVTILRSGLRVVSAKHLQGFREAQEIVATPNSSPEGRQPKLSYNRPPSRLWLGRPGSSPEFFWHHQYLECGRRNKGQPFVLEYLLLGRNGEFYVLTTTWEKEKGGFRFSNDTLNGHLKVKHLRLEEVVVWCGEDQNEAPYRLRTVIERLHQAAVETEQDLAARLVRAKKQREEIGRRLGTISWVQPGLRVWIVLHSHSWDRQLCNEYRPLYCLVTKVEKGQAYFEFECPRPLHDCYKTEEECRSHCPDPHND